jgi:FtsP/CotA-like multicopper oxidase with cupredoxin domain
LTLGSTYPSPTLRARRGDVFELRLENRLAEPTNVHWHGLAAPAEADGYPTDVVVPGVTRQYAFQIDDRAGTYWYHPHLREDYGQDMGIYGNLIVKPADPDYWPPVHREIPLTLDDVLLEDGRVGPFSPTETTHVAMGRFGQVFLVGGETEHALEARRREIIRFFLTNTANTGSSGWPSLAPG